MFPITGGLVDMAGNLYLPHNGSGLLLSNGNSSIGLENFFIDTSLGILTADASVNGSAFGPIAVFSIQPDLALTLTAAGATAVEAVFGLPSSLTFGLEIGVADIKAVPIPPAFLLLGSALLGFGAWRRRA